VRARLVDVWPALSHHFDIHPWDVERLTFRELNAYVKALNDLAREQQKQQRQAQARRPRR